MVGTDHLADRSYLLDPYPYRLASDLHFSNRITEGTTRMNTRSSALALALAVVVAFLPPAASVADQGDAQGLVFSVRKFCRDDATTRVRVRVANPTNEAREVFYTVTFSTGRQKLYGTTVWKRTPRSVLIGVTVPADGTARVTAGTDGRDVGAFRRAFHPNTC